MNNNNNSNNDWSGNFNNANIISSSNHNNNINSLHTNRQIRQAWVKVVKALIRIRTLKFHLCAMLPDKKLLREHIHNSLMGVTVSQYHADPDFNRSENLSNLFTPFLLACVGERQVPRKTFDGASSSSFMCRLARALEETPEAVHHSLRESGLLQIQELRDSGYLGACSQAAGLLLQDQELAELIQLSLLHAAGKPENDPEGSTLQGIRKLVVLLAEGGLMPASSMAAVAVAALHSKQRRRLQGDETAARVVQSVQQLLLQHDSFVAIWGMLRELALLYTQTLEDVGGLTATLRPNYRLGELRPAHRLLRALEKIEDYLFDPDTYGDDPGRWTNEQATDQVANAAFNLCVNRGGNNNILELLDAL